VCKSSDEPGGPCRCSGDARAKAERAERDVAALEDRVGVLGQAARCSDLAEPLPDDDYWAQVLGDPECEFHAPDCDGRPFCDGCGWIGPDMLWNPGSCPADEQRHQVDRAECGIGDAAECLG
jgi:hypothetical protein